MSATSAVLLAVEESSGGVELPAPAWALGVITFGILVLLLLITLSFDRDR